MYYAKILNNAFLGAKESHRSVLFIFSVPKKYI